MDRATNKILPAITPSPAKPIPASRLTLQEIVQREVQHHAEVKQRHVAVGFLDRFFHLFADYSHHSGRHHKRKLGAVSTRSAKEITSELRAFYETRPRPWRPAGNRPKRSGIPRDVRRMHLQGAARFVAAGNRKPEDFGTRMKNALLRYFA